MNKNAEPTSQESPLSAAIGHCLKAIEQSKKKVFPREGDPLALKPTLWDTTPIFRSVGVVLHALKMNRLALHCAVQLVQALEDPRFDPKMMGHLVKAFKTASVQARAHQNLPRMRNSDLGMPEVREPEGPSS